MTTSRALLCSALTGLALAMLLPAVAAHCAPLGEELPQSLGGMPQGVPQRSQAPAAYPAVHDVPPPRSVPTLSPEQQLRLEQDLANVRARHIKLQDPNVRGRTDSANAANAAAMEKARAAAKSMKPAPAQ